MKRTILACMLPLLFLAGTPSNANAMCFGDSWGTNYTTMFLVSHNFRMQSFTRINHNASHLCSGFLNGKVTLLGIGGGCYGQDSRFHDTSENPINEVVVTKDCAVPQCDFTYSAGSEHDWNGQEQQFTDSFESSDPCECKPNGQSCSDPSECCSNLCADPAFECGNPSPILINLKNGSSNYHLTSARAGVRFDIDADGDLEQVSWTEADSEVAFLVLDRNGDGTIGDASELFGTETLKINGRAASNGFEALIDLDGGPASSDGKVDSTDPYYPQLQLWLDHNHNGVSEPAELITLEEAGVTTIFTSYREIPRIDKNGNAYRYVGEALIRKNGQPVRRIVFDVFLQVMRN
jgi:hypothetical protein